MDPQQPPAAPPPAAPPPPAPGAAFGPPPAPPPGAPASGPQGAAGQAPPTFLVQQMGTEIGPYGPVELRALATAGQLRASTLVRRADGAGGQFSAGDIPGVFSDKDWLAALLLSVFLGQLGIDRFYLGYPVLGILKLITCGGCLVWWILDLVLLATNRMPDARGLPLRRN